MTLEDCCTRCSNAGCRTTVCRDDNPAALQGCGDVVCDLCVTCDRCQDGAA